MPVLLLRIWFLRYYGPIQSINANHTSQLLLTAWNNQLLVFVAVVGPYYGQIDYFTILTLILIRIQSAIEQVETERAV